MGQISGSGRTEEWGHGLGHGLGMVVFERFQLRFIGLCYVPGR